MQEFYKYIIKIACITALVCFSGRAVSSSNVEERFVLPLLQDSSQLDSASRTSLGDTTASVDSLSGDTLLNGGDSTLLRKKSSLEDIITSKNKDSLVFDVNTNTLKMYREGTVEHQEKILDAEYIEMLLDLDLIRAYGRPDSANIYKKPVFTDKNDVYNMDSIIYNLKSEKIKVYGFNFEEGEGTLQGKDMKRSEEGIFNIRRGIFSTCTAEHPHFCVVMPKAQYVQGTKNKKMISGPLYLELEGVPLPLGLPFVFFPVMTNTNSGFIFPEIGEENLKGFFVRGAGYYFVFNDYMDLAARAGIYTLGSWEGSLESTYRKRYKYNGNYSFNYSKDIIGDRTSADYQNMNNYRLLWSHQQDPKFRPGSTFSANVNFSTSNYNKYDAQNMNDYISAQTNSSISYSKTWLGTPFSFSTNMQHSQNNRDSSIMLSLPNFVFNVSRVFPFKRREAVGKQRWYEKISFSYTTTFSNSVRTKQNLFLKQEMFEDMRYAMKHDIPISTSLNVLKYLNISPGFNYSERWYFKKIEKGWNPESNRVDIIGEDKGFYRVYNYSFSANLSTCIYGMFEFKGKNPVIKAIRHVMTPSASGSYIPDFGKQKYGFYQAIQGDAAGNMIYYSPFEQGMYGVPGRGAAASLSFSLGNTLEMKARSKTDSLGFKKIKLLESLSISSSYNFLADSLNLAPFSVSARTTLFKSLGINITARFDPYSVNEKGQKINRFAIKDGKLARLTSLGFSFGYSFRSVFGLDKGTGSDALPAQPNNREQEFFDRNSIDYARQQEIMASKYYDFSVPWNLGFNYTFSYSKPGVQKKLTQTLGFNGSINLTPKWGINFNGGYDFESRKLTPGTVSLTRDLHCWQMDFSWVPIGFRKSWNFTIRVKSGMLSDLKYEKSSGYLDNYSYY